MSNDTITIDMSAVNKSFIDNNMSSTYINGSGLDIGTISITSGTSDTITFTGIDEYVNVTKAEHTELMDRVAKLEAVIAEEAELRAQHPALKTAYDEYRLLLVLAKRHTSDLLTGK